MGPKINPYPLSFFSVNMHMVLKVKWYQKANYKKYQCPTLHHLPGLCAEGGSSNHLASPLASNLIISK